MKFRSLLFLIFIFSCSSNYTKLDNRKPYNSTGIAYIYNEQDFINKVIKKKLTTKCYKYLIKI